MARMVVPADSDGAFEPHVLPNHHGARLFRRSAELLPYPRLKLPPLPADMPRVYSHLFSVAFPAPSRYSMCCDAARALGCCPDTIERIITGASHKADFPLIALASLAYEQRTGQPFTFPGLSLRLVAVKP